MYLILRNLNIINYKLNCRAFQNTAVIYFRKKNPGISRRLKIYGDDNAFNEELEDEEDLSNLETDFHNIDLSYNEHKKEVRKKKDIIEKMITKKKFFTELKPPNMLTWAERVQIKKLHEKDPEEWNLDTLAEGFPANREIISKILRTKWKPESFQKLKRRDARVYENWKLLAEGKLEADPKLLEHLKKFLPRREQFLESLKNEEFEKLIEAPKQNKVWNNGQMCSILESYERALDKIENQIKGKKMIEAKSDRMLLEERIKFEKDMIGEKETFLLGGSNGRVSKDCMTLSQLKESFHVKRQTRGDLNITEKVIADKSLNAVSRNTTSPTINNKLASLAGYTLAPRSRDKPLSISKVIEPDKNIVNVAPKEDETQSSDLLKELTLPPKEKPETFEKTNDICVTKIQEYSIEDKITSTGNFNESKNFSSENQNFNLETEKTNSNFGQFDLDLKATTCSKPSNLPMEVTSHSEKSAEIQNSREVLDECNFSYEKEEEKLIQEERTIQGTFFWDKSSKIISHATQEENTENIIEIPHMPVDMLEKHSKENAQIKEIKQWDDYPNKIKIPKGKRGSGLTFRVNDCFYDDDGEFLYRVPGMTNKQISDKQ